MAAMAVGLLGLPGILEGEIHQELMGSFWDAVGLFDFLCDVIWDVMGFHGMWRLVIRFDGNLWDFTEMLCDFIGFTSNNSD